MTRSGLLTAVIEAVASADGIETAEVDPLHDAIDPDILNKLDRMEAERDWRFTFQYGDHQITVTDDSQVFIDGELYWSEQSM